MPDRLRGDCLPVPASSTAVGRRLSPICQTTVSHLGRLYRNRYEGKRLEALPDGRRPYEVTVNTYQGPRYTVVFASSRAGAKRAAEDRHGHVAVGLRVLNPRVAA